MEKYEQHGLTRAQDDILGGFGDAGPLESISNYSITPEQRVIIKQMINMGLLESHMLEDFSVEFRLTPKGRKLWHIRNTEESEGPQ